MFFNLFILERRWLSPCTGLEHATIRYIIIFGYVYGYNEQRYQAVIEACALVRNLEMFAVGEQTGNIIALPVQLIDDDAEIGEREITLSGGQSPYFSGSNTIFPSDGMRPLIYISYRTNAYVSSVHHTR